MHEQFEAREAVKTSSDRSFGVVFAVVFALIGFAPWVLSGDIRWWAVAVSASFLVLSIAAPRALAPLNRLWTKFGFLLHRIMNPLIMGFMFFLVVTPIGVIMRVLGKRPMQIELDDEAESYWISRTPPGPAPESMKQQF